MDRQFSAISLYAVGCKRRLCMFTCSMDQGCSGTQIFALLIRTVVVYYTQVLQVRIEGMELQKGTAKKEMKKNVPSRARKIFLRIAQSKALSFFLLTSHAAENAYFSSANRELSNAIRVV